MTDLEDVARRYRWFAWQLAQGEEAKAAGLLEEAYRDGTDTDVRLDLRGTAQHQVRRRGGR